MVNSTDILIGGLRGLLFTAAFISAMTFFREFNAVWLLFARLFHNRQNREDLTMLAAFGWFLTACASMCLTGPRILQALFYHRSPAGVTHGWDAMWTCIGFSGLALGFYIPVVAMLWYRGKLWYGSALGLLEVIIGCIFAWLAFAMR